jgi:hypothetical protein
MGDVGVGVSADPVDAEAEWQRTCGVVGRRSPGAMLARPSSCWRLITDPSGAVEFEVERPGSSPPW